MKLMKFLLVILIVIVNLVPTYSFAESQPTPEPTGILQPVDTTSQNSEIVSNSNPVTIYVFSVSLLGLKMGKRIFPVYINGLLISGLDYSKYIRYETTETKIKVATVYIEVSSSKELLSSNLIGNPVYSEIIIQDAKPGDVYYFEIRDSNISAGYSNRIKQLTAEEAQKRLKNYKEQEY